MIDPDHLTVDSARGRDDELFTTPSADPTPDRHPSILRPGGHSSPLKHPSALRPGASRNSRTPSPNNAAPTLPPAKASRASPSPVAYKAYVPSGPQSPSDELSAEIEGYFTALEVAPLHISKTPEPSTAALPQPPPKEQDRDESSLEQRCASPPVPPKERVSSPPVPPKEKVAVDEERHVVSPISELEAHPERRGSVVDEEDAPPPYEPSQPVITPIEKPSLAHETSDGSPSGAAEALSAQAHEGMALSDVPVGVIPETSTTTLAQVSSVEEMKPAEQEQREGDEDDIYSAAPPSLPPRPSPPSAVKGKKSAMPEAPALPTRPAPEYKTSGAAATSAAGVGGSIAGVGQSAGLKQARKALEKGLGRLIDKAKEHQHAREQHTQERKTTGKKQSPDEATKKRASSGNMAQVRLMKP
ncbi:unnamed protein product [Discula destructiva]